MVKYKKIIFLLLLISIFFTAGFSKLLVTPKIVYRVYLKGESLGLISSKKELNDYIDQKEAEVKEKYDVDNVYAPTDLDIVKELTYYDKISSVETIYNKIKNISPFTINGYQIKINGVTTTDASGKEIKGKTQYIYVLDKKVFTDAVENTAKAFIKEKAYEAFANNTQEEITETGTIIEKIFIENKITIKKYRIPVNKTIYMDKEKLSQYLLFGTTKPQQTYTVKDGDTIEDIANNNRISTEEFLIANPDITSLNSLLYPGQQVTLGILKPQINIVEEDYIVKDEDQNYTTVTEEDPNQYTSYSQVKQAGVKGRNRVTQRIQKVNGETLSVVTVSTEVLKEPVQEIVVKGTKKYSSGYFQGGYGSVIPTVGIFGWPATCSTISSNFGWRWGVLHDGTDIAGCGYGSNIFAAESGVVVESGYRSTNGQYITIRHYNGYYTMYAHLCNGCRYVSVGDVVQKGQVIGGMGQTGFATGVHLHFAVWTGFPYRGGTALNAMSFY